MGTLIGFEVKKILMKKSTIVAFLILFGLQVLLGFMGNLGSTYINDEFYETHAQRNRLDRENGIALSGRAMDESLLAEVQEAWAELSETSWNGKEYMWSDTYKEKVRQYDDLTMRLKAWGAGSGLSFDNMTEEKLYGLFEERFTELSESYELTDGELAYWEEKKAMLLKPYTYEYAFGYEQLVDMQGIYMTCMMVTFFIAISMVTVFADEHTGKTDQLILCARHGKTKLYTAKILAGSLIVFGVNLLFTLVHMVGQFFCYGPEGFGATIQSVMAPWYAYELTMGETFLIMAGLMFVSSVLVAIFAMLLAEILRSSIGAMAIVVGLLFAARLVPMPVSIRVLFHGWNFMPINLLKIDQGFLDLQLVNLFGLKLTNWQFAPILYVMLIAVMVFVGGKVYRKYQVTGR